MRVLSKNNQLRERRKINLIIHNIPESDVHDLPGRNREDTQSVHNLIENDLNIDGVEITKVIRLGG